MAEGTITWMTGPATLAEHTVPTLSQGRRRRPAGPTPRVVAGLPVCVTDDVDAARERAAGVFAIYGAAPVVPGDARPRGRRGPGRCRHRR